MADKIAVTKVPVPESTRLAKPNPYKELAETAANDRESAYRLPLGKDDKLASVTRLLRLAGADAGVTLRILPDDKENPTSLTVWAVDKIVRPRKDKK